MNGGKMYTINGKFLSRHMNGQIRVAIETIKELDKIIKPGQLEIVAPKSEHSIDGLKNISIIRVGKGNPHIWEQTTFFWYLIKNRRVGINFLNTHPFLKPDISYIHDVLFSAYPNLYNTIYGRFQKVYTNMMIKTAVRRAKKIITVSYFSKEQILKYFSADRNKIHVIYNGWQHMNRIAEDENVFQKYPKIQKRKYLMAASGITPQKNFKWIVENAKLNKDEKYLIVGSKEKSTQDDIKNIDNLIFTDRVSDVELKTLMKNCKAFIHPAIYEGFGMTPLEAAGCGCKRLIVANASCLPEIYGDKVDYIDPLNPNIKMKDILVAHKEDNINKLLQKYSWEETAQKLYKLIFEA